MNLQIKVFKSALIISILLVKLDIFAIFGVFIYVLG